MTAVRARWQGMFASSLIALSACGADPSDPSLMPGASGSPATCAPDMCAAPSRERRAFGGSALVIVRAIRGEVGSIVLTATSGSLQTGSVTLQSVGAR
jgi:hypothetical protein